MTCVVLRCRWGNIFFLNVYTPSEENSDDIKESIYEKLEHVFNNFTKYHKKILFGDFNTKLGRENIFKPKTGNEHLHQDINDSGVRIANIATSKNLFVKSTLFPHRNIHKYISNLSR